MESDRFQLGLLLGTKLTLFSLPDWPLIRTTKTKFIENPKSHKTEIKQKQFGLTVGLWILIPDSFSSSHKRQQFPAPPAAVHHLLVMRSPSIDQRRCLERFGHQSCKRSVMWAKEEIIVPFLEAMGGEWGLEDRRESEG